MKKILGNKQTVWRDIRGVILSFMILIIIATGFNTFLSCLAFKNIYVNSTISQYNVVGNLLKKKIEIALSFGKNIETFFGMEDLLHINQRYLELMSSDQLKSSDVHILILAPDGEVLHTTEKGRIKDRLAPEVVESLNLFADATPDAKNYFIKEEHYFITFPIKNWDNSMAAIQVISFPEKLITEYLITLLNSSMIAWCWVLTLSFIMLLSLFYLSVYKNRKKNRSDSPLSIFKTKKFSYSLFIIIAFCQILFSFSQLHKFNRDYLAINQDKAETLNYFIKDQLGNLLKKGIDLKNLNQAEQFIGNMISDTPEFYSIMISDKRGNLLYYADRESRLNYRSANIAHIDLNKPQRYLRTMSLMNGDEEAGAISILISEKTINGLLKKILMDAATIVLISIFFCVEIMILLFIRLRKKDQKHHEKDQISTLIIRPVAFIYFFAIDIVISFIPLYMKDLYYHYPILYISEKMSLGLPITVQMIFTAVSILIVGSWCDRKGWQQPFLFGLFFSAIGYVAAAVSKSPIMFLLSIAMAGFGYGLSYIAAQNFVTINSEAEKKAHGLSEYYAGCIAGSLCGTVTGGMLAEQIGFDNVFLTGAAIMISLLVWVGFFMRSYFPRFKRLSIPEKLSSPITLFSFFKDIQISSMLLLNIIPASIIVVGFLNFFVPVYLQKNGISQSDIGRIFMIYGFCLIYIAPLIIKRINTSKHSILYITIGSTLVSMTLLTFSLFSGYAAVLISIILLGLGASFNALRNAYMLNLEISRKFGEGRATSVIFFLARLGQAVGPIIFAWFTIAGDNTSGVIRIGIVFLSLSIVFFVLNKFSTKEAVL